MRCRGADSRARRNAADPYRPSLKWYALPNCHCEERSDVAISGRHSQPVQGADKNVKTDCVCSGGHCAAVGGFAALRMRRPLYGERAPCEEPFNRARALVHRGTPLTCHSEERSDVGISCRQLRFRRECPVIRPGTARLPRPLWGLAMTIRNPCMFGDAAQQPVTAKGAY